VRSRDSRSRQGEPTADLGIQFVVALAAVLAVWNNAANLVPAFVRWYVPVNLAATLALVLWARRAGYSPSTLGLYSGDVASGLRWGAAAFALVAVVIASALATPAAQPWLQDGRIAGKTGAEVAFLALVRIPLGTVVLEEVAFRGVLFGAWRRLRGTVPAVVGSSLVFGLWHVVPTMDLLDANDLATDPAARLGAIVAAVGFTAVAGVLFCLLRIVSGSVLAPMLAHTATNSLAAGAAHVATG
jgi:uncharacterized protein